MKFISHILFAVPVPFFICCNEPIQPNTEKIISKNADTVSGTYGKYRDEQKGFSIAYPADWDTIKGNPVFPIIVVERDKDTADKFNESYSISVFPSEGRTVDEIIATNIELAKQKYPAAKMRKSEQVNKNGIDCTVLELVVEAKGVTIINYATMYFNDKNLYTLTFSMEEAKKKKYLEILDHVANSFEWLDTDTLPDTTH